jgi:hypothetical protein
VSFRWTLDFASLSQTGQKLASVEDPPAPDQMALRNELGAAELGQRKQGSALDLMQISGARAIGSFPAVDRLVSCIFRYMSEQKSHHLQLLPTRGQGDIINCFVIFFAHAPHLREVKYNLSAKSCPI